MTSPGEGTRDLRTSPINTPIPIELKERLVQYSDDNGVSQATVVRLALNEYLTRAGYGRRA